MARGGKRAGAGRKPKVDQEPQNKLRTPGRPTAFQESYAEQARKLCELGATDQDLANFFEVSRSTISLWQSVHASFSDALKAGKASADDRVERSLFHRATGYSHDAVKFHVVEGRVVETSYVEHYPPDTVAGIFWLKNRRREKWRDKPNPEGDDASVMTIVHKNAPDDNGVG